MEAGFIACEGCQAQIGAWRSACPECGLDRKTGHVNLDARARPVASGHPEAEPVPAWSSWVTGLVALGAVAGALRFLSPPLAAGLSIAVAVAWVVFFLRKR